MSLCRIALVAGLLLSGTVAARPARPPTPSKRTVVRFDGDDIDGSLTRPDGDLVAGRRQRNRPPVARAPVDFEEAARQDLLEAAGRVRRP
jgi:hypothetical protein